VPGIGPFTLLPYQGGARMLPAFREGRRRDYTLGGIGTEPVPDRPGDIRANPADREMATTPGAVEPDFAGLKESME
jgi:hypothetical protein